MNILVESKLDVLIATLLKPTIPQQQWNEVDNDFYFCSFDSIEKISQAKSEKYFSKKYIFEDIDQNNSQNIGVKKLLILDQDELKSYNSAVKKLVKNPEIGVYALFESEYTNISLDEIVENINQFEIITLSAKLEILSLAKYLNIKVTSCYQRYFNYSNYYIANNDDISNESVYSCENPYYCFFVSTLGTLGGVQTFIDRFIRTNNFAVKIVANNNSNLNLHTYKDAIEVVDAAIDKKRAKEVLDNAIKTITIDFNNAVSYMNIARNFNYNVFFVGDAKDITAYSYYRNAYNLLKSNMYFSKIIFLGDENANVFRKNFHYKNVDAVYLYLEDNPCKIYEEKNKFIIITRFHQNAKNIFELINVSRALKGTNIEVEVYGDGTLMSEIDGKLKRINNENINLMGKLDNELLIDKLGSYKALLVMSESEGNPTVVLEAIKAQIPIISYDRYTIAKVFVTSDVGVLVKYGDTATFVQVMNNIDNYDFKPEDFIEKQKLYSASRLNELYRKVLLT